MIINNLCVSEYVWATNEQKCMKFSYSAFMFKINIYFSFLLVDHHDIYWDYNNDGLDDNNEETFRRLVFFEIFLNKKKFIWIEIKNSLNVIILVF